MFWVIGHVIERCFRTRAFAWELLFETGSRLRTGVANWLSFWSLIVVSLRFVALCSAWLCFVRVLLCFALLCDYGVIAVQSWLDYDIDIQRGIDSLYNRDSAMLAELKIKV